MTIAIVQQLRDCSELVIRLYQAVNRLTYITDHEMYPPARIPLINGLTTVGRYVIKPDTHLAGHTSPGGSRLILGINAL
jgi:hypothetical protein